MVCRHRQGRIQRPGDGHCCLVVVPDRGGYGQQALGDAYGNSGGGSAAMLFQVELALGGIVDRLDEVPDLLEYRFAVTGLLRLAGRACWRRNDPVHSFRLRQSPFGHARCGWGQVARLAMPGDRGPLAGGCVRGWGGRTNRLCPGTAAVGGSARWHHESGHPEQPEEPKQPRSQPA